MSDRETSPDTATLAGRILAAGNPLDNDQVFMTLIDRIASANTGSKAREAAKSVLQPYFENMLSLAGSCLSQTEQDDDSEHPRIVITATVNWDKITNAIIGSFEGGSTEWLGSCDYIYTPEGVTGNPLYAENDFWSKGGKARLTYDNPDGDDLLQKEIGLLEIKAGLRSMAEKDPVHFDDLLGESDDAITHDVFMQHVIFGEIIYG